MEVTKAIFFDNEEIHFQKFLGCDSVTLVKIPSSKILEEKPWSEYSAVNIDNTYFSVMKTIYTGDYYDKSSGIQAEHIDMLHKWSAETSGLTRAILLDWDRTITQVEGFICPYDAQKMEEYKSTLIRELDSQSPDFIKEVSILRGLPNITAEDMLLYLIGGKERLKQIREMLDFSHKKGIQIVIITNALSSQSPVFDELLDKLFNKIPYTKISSRFAPFYGDKYLALQPRFSSICKPNH